MIKLIDFFDDEYYFLSNFYPSPFFLDGYNWATVEHYFQAQKTYGVNQEQYNAIKDATTPGWAKKLGRGCDIRNDWEDVKFFVMKKALIAKFTQNAKLYEMLLDTGKAELIEGNSWHDNIWGDCVCHKCKDIEGKNALGTELMLIRQIRKEQLV